VWIGQEPVEDPYILIGQLASVYFFVYFLIFIPLLGKLEAFLIHYKADEEPKQWDSVASQTLTFTK
jgi:quinol-cytochrome oxidoreductase complex cytochrome b subunit